MNGRIGPVADSVLPAPGGFVMRIAATPGALRPGGHLPVNLPDGRVAEATVKTFEFEPVTGGVAVGIDRFPGYGVVTLALPLPQVEAPCRGTCGGTDRTTSPARYATSHSGQRGLFCSCCEQWLVSSGLVDSDAVSDRFVPGVRATITRYACENCGYDVQSVGGVS